MPEIGGLVPQVADSAERRRAIDPAGSFVVQAPAGSGKTSLLVERFLRLLAGVDRPDEVVAITFSRAAAAEMQNRVLEALEAAQKDADGRVEQSGPTGMAELARLALAQSERRGWRLLDQPEQLRITTIDSFCRSMALKRPLEWGILNALGGRLDPMEKAQPLYSEAAARLFERLSGPEDETRLGLEGVLGWRDNSWTDVQNLVAGMLAVRSRWYQEFVLARDRDWESLKKRLESPMQRAAFGTVERLHGMLDRVPGAREEAMRLARFACETPGDRSPRGLAERVEIPSSRVSGTEEARMEWLRDSADAFGELAKFLQTKGQWRKEGGLNAGFGFPPTPAGKGEKKRHCQLTARLEQEPGLREALADFEEAMPTGYTEEEWEIVQHCFVVLRETYGLLQTVFMEASKVDFTEIERLALNLLAPVDGFPSDFAQAEAAGIRHLLIDEFQDTNRLQHELLARLIAAWPEREGRTCFCVGDPMQSIYGFRESDVELFERTKREGIPIAVGGESEPFLFDSLRLTSNFRTVPSLVEDLNCRFTAVFAEDDGSGITFSAANPARKSNSIAEAELHLRFTTNAKRGANSAEREPTAEELAGDPEETLAAQTSEIADLIAQRLNRELAAGTGRFRIAVLGRAKKTLQPIAVELRRRGIAFRAMDLEPLGERPEVRDALALARALLNPMDRTAWLGVLRAPWCGLSLEELYWLTSADDEKVLGTPVLDLLQDRLSERALEGRFPGQTREAARRVGRLLREAEQLRAEVGTMGVGSWVAAVWRALGGEDTVTAEQRENVRLLWRCLDELPQGEPDLLGATLKVALEGLFALPDPGSSAEFGVQLMTIHKSKGLEFEVVIVPDLEKKPNQRSQEMLSWLERGVAAGGSGELDELTEFLIAPIGTKGVGAGAARKWVNAAKERRETQEMRRLLYVAATRAREELHLFARPRFSADKTGELKLAKAQGLLQTAWPAFGGDVEGRFTKWLETIQQGAAETEFSDKPSFALAAAEVAQMPAATRPTLLKRLPEGYAPPRLRLPGKNSGLALNASVTNGGAAGDEGNSLYARTEGGLLSRLEGLAIHEWMERLSGLRQTYDSAEARARIVLEFPRVASRLRGAGVPLDPASEIARRALAVVTRAAETVAGDWVLRPHSGAQTEASWMHVVRGRTWNLRPDRVFFAAAPGEADGEASWWIVDYKSADAQGLQLEDQEQAQRFLGLHREKYQGQLEAYADGLRELNAAEFGPDRPTAKIRLGIYYPRVLLFDGWWT